MPSRGIYRTVLVTGALLACLLGPAIPRAHAVAGCALPSGATNRPAVAANPDGRLEIFARCSTGAVAHNWQLVPNGRWAGWSTFTEAALAGAPVAGTNADGRLEIFALQAGGAVLHKWQLPGGTGWSAWTSLGGTASGDPAVARNADGRLEVFARHSDGSLWHAWQSAPNAGWSSWASLGGSTVGTPAIGRNADGRLEIFMRAGNGALQHNWQRTAGSGWFGWRGLPGTATSDLAVAINSDGRLDLFGRETDGALWHQTQTAPNAGWGSWTRLGGSLAADASGRAPGPVTAVNADGRLEVFGAQPDGSLAHTWQVSPGGAWWPWTSLGGSNGYNATVARNADGRLEAFGLDTSGTLAHAWQTTANGNWSSWQALTDPRPPYPTHSHYLTWSGNSSADNTKAYNIGCTEAGTGVPGVRILDYGTQEAAGLRQPGTSAASTTPRLSYAGVASTALEYMHGFLDCRPSIAVNAVVALGVNNKSDGGVTGSTAGARWAQLVNDVTAAMRSRGYDRSGMRVTGAMDFEPSFGSAAQARAWADAYAAATSTPLYDYGAADGCPSYGSTSTSCNNGWTLGDRFYVATGAGPQFSALPEIYLTSGVQAQQWAAISAWGVANGRGQLRFAGALAQFTACQQRGGCTGHSDNTPATAWNQLWNALRAHPDTFTNSLPYSSDIRWE